MTVARFGGDEFALLLEGIGDAGEVVAVAERVHAALRAPFRLGGLELRTTASVGIAIGGPAAKVGDLLRDADTAMYRAKAGGPGRTAVFDAGMRAAATRRLMLEAGMQRALERGEFRLAYQPIVALATGAITGFEALARWEHPRLGLVMPGEFIPIAEEAGLILPLGAWILSEACRQLGAWRRETPSGEALTIAVNLSARQIAQPGLIERVERVLAEAGLPPAALHLEITEGGLVAERKRRSRRSRGCAGWGSASTSTTSGWSTRRSTTCGASRSTESRSISHSFATCSRASGTARWCGRSWRWRTAWGCG